MNDDCDRHPADLVNESDCPPARDLGFTADRNYVSVVGSMRSEGHGHGWSWESQEEADRLALEKAVEHAKKIMKVKINALGLLRHVYRTAQHVWGRFSNAWKAFKYVAPLNENKWNGAIKRKPWEYRISAVVPHLDTLESLVMCIETLRAQTERPYIMVIDTGSDPDTCDHLEALRGEDLEVHFIRAGAYSHSSEPVTAALDLAHSLCRSEYLYHTHSDVFIRREDFLADLLARCSAQNPVVGYRMSSREWLTDEWKGMVGHTATLLHMPTIHRAGAVWSMQKMHHVYGYPWTIGMGWPDTEIAFNRTLSAVGIKPDFIGFDRNFERSVDRNIDHVRSYPGMKVYDECRFNEKEVEMACAINEASIRMAMRGRKHPLPEGIRQSLVNEI